MEWIITRCIFEWNSNFDYLIHNIDCILPHTICNCLIISIFALLWPHGLKHQPFIFLSFSRRCLKSKCINYSFKFEAFIDISWNLNRKIYLEILQTKTSLWVAKTIFIYNINLCYIMFSQLQYFWVMAIQYEQKLKIY